MSSPSKTITRRTLGLAALLWLFSAAEAASQACLGVPTLDGHTAVSLDLGLSQPRNSYGISISANLRGPLSLAGGWALIKARDIAPNGDEMGATLALELPGAWASVCPSVGVGHTRFQRFQNQALVTTSRTLIPVGLYVGRTVPMGENRSLTGYVSPQVVFARTKLAYESGDFVGTDEGPAIKDTEFGLEAGVKLSVRRFFGGAGLRLTTLDDTDPTLAVALGILVGG